MSGGKLGAVDFELGDTNGFWTTIGRMQVQIGKKSTLSGDLCDFYEVVLSLPPALLTEHKGSRFDRILEEDEGDSTRGLLKVVRDPLDNDLLANEQTVLSKLFPLGAKDEKFNRYLPRCYGSAVVRQKHMNLLHRYDFFVSLEEVQKEYPKGLDFRDVVWMFKRTLVGLGFAHTQGYVHGAVILPHVLVHPVDHGAKIIDWAYAVTGDDRIKAFSAGYQDYYPPEVFRKEKPTARTDIFMAAKCAWALLGGDVRNNTLPAGHTVPKEVENFFLMCMEPSSRRPDNAWDLHESFDNLLLKVVGKPIYRRLKMPDGVL